MNTYTLPNGLRILHLPTSSPVVYSGIAVDAGSRDEEPGEQGMAHYVEHMLFKGTTHRRACHILNRMEVVGGDLNAFTYKEETIVYCAISPRTSTAPSNSLPTSPCAAPSPRKRWSARWK